MNIISESMQARMAEKHGRPSKMLTGDVKYSIITISTNFLAAVIVITLYFTSLVSGQLLAH